MITAIFAYLMFGIVCAAFFTCGGIALLGYIDHGEDEE